MDAILTTLFLLLALLTLVVGGTAAAYIGGAFTPATAITIVVAVVTVVTTTGVAIIAPTVGHGPVTTALFTAFWALITALSGATAIIAANRKPP